MTVDCAICYFCYMYICVFHHKYSCWRIVDSRSFLSLSLRFSLTLTLHSFCYHRKKIEERSEESCKQLWNIEKSFTRLNTNAYIYVLMTFCVCHLKRERKKRFVIWLFCYFFCSYLISPNRRVDRHKLKHIKLFKKQQHTQAWLKVFHMNDTIV